MVLNAAIRAAETAVDSGRTLPLGEISDPETERLADLIPRPSA